MKNHKTWAWLCVFCFFMTMLTGYKRKMIKFKRRFLICLKMSGLCKKILSWDKVAVFAGGVLFGTAGLKVLGSKDAKKVYTQGTAAVLRAKDCVMKTTNVVQENAEDILAEAKQINEKRYEKENSVEEAEEAEETTEATEA